MRSKATYMKRYLLLLFFLSHLSFSFSQEVLFTANDYYKELKYYKAIKFYKKALQKKETYTATVRLADCYRFLDISDSAEFWYHQALSFVETDYNNHFFYAQALKSNGKFAEAKQQFILWGMKLPDMEDESKRFALSCDLALKWLENPAPYNVQNVSFLNTPDAEFCPAITHNGIIFTSDKLPTSDSIPRLISESNGRPFYKLYRAEIKDTTVKSIVAFDPPVNGSYHNGPGCFSKHEDTLVFTRTNIDPLKKFNFNKLEIYFAINTDKGYKRLIPFPYNSADYSVAHPSLSSDGKRLYFTSDVPGGYGGKDIYVCKKDESGNWSQPENLGPDVNTSYDEEFPYEHKKNELYFSSNGHIGMGGLDIFRAIKKDSVWRDIENMYPPINSPKDDLGMFFFTDSTGKEQGYFSSNRTGGKGRDDIYFFDLKPRDTSKPAEVLTIKKDSLPTEPSNLAQDIIKQLKIAGLHLRKVIADSSTTPPAFKYLLTGVVKEDNPTVTTEKVLSDVEISAINKYDGSTIVTQTDSKGRFEFEHKNNVKKYIIRAKKEGYFTNSIELNIDDLPTDSSIDLKVKNSVAVLENIEYEFNDYKLLPQSLVQLNKLVNILKDNVLIKIEMKSYTDARGSDQYNLALSQKRAKSAKDYLVSQGITALRIKSFGLGETNLIVENATSEAEHQLNRRTEFKLIYPGKK